jgi:DNA-binding MurR/RpiR family transcriptional regulator
MERLAQGAAQAELARSYGVSQSTISRLGLHLALSGQARSARDEV